MDKHVYRPRIFNAREVGRYRFHRHTAVLLTDVAALGSIRYHHALVVQEIGGRGPCIYVTSEMSTSDPAKSFFCIFDHRGHHNERASMEWNTLHRFEERALEVLVPRIGSPIVRTSNRV